MPAFSPSLLCLLELAFLYERLPLGIGDSVALDDIDRSVVGIPGRGIPVLEAFGESLSCQGNLVRIGLDGLARDNLAFRQG